MSHSLTEKQSKLLSECLSMAQNLTQHADAERCFLELEETLSGDPATLEILTTVWKELLAVRRAATFWQQISDVEKAMSERLADSHIQLQQNYMRLMQEQ